MIDFSDNHRKLYHVVNGAKGSAIEDVAHWEAITTNHGTNYFPLASEPGSVDYAAVALTDGFPTGRMGIYTTVTNTVLTYMKVWEHRSSSQVTSRWTSYAFTNAGEGSYGTMNASEDDLRTAEQFNQHPVFLNGLKLQKFQATFRFSGDMGANGCEVYFIFDGQDQSNYDSVHIEHSGSAGYVSCRTRRKGTYSEVSYAGGLSSLGATDWRWVRVTSDGTNLSVKCIDTNGSAPDETAWSGASTIYTTSSLPLTGGRFGFVGGNGYSTHVDDLTVKSYTSAGGGSWVTEQVEDFTLDGSALPTSDSSTLAYDNNGNLLYDGIQAYTYDPWNRLITVAHAYRDSGGVHPGQTFATMSYDALGRRIVKAISGTGVEDCTYHEYWSGVSIIEERNGSDQYLKDHVWGIKYIDEAVQTRVNTNLATPSWTSYWHLQDANFNDLAIVDSSGDLVERYEYSAYGQRQAVFSDGANDGPCYAPTLQSQKVVISSVPMPWGINDFGHQGLMHDEQMGLISNRARMLHPGLGRFIQEEPLGASYADSPNLFEVCDSNTLRYTDWSGYAPRYGFWSGINSNRSNYVTNAYHLPYVPDENLSGFSDLTTFTTGPWPFAQDNLNREARIKPNRLPNMCKGSSKTKIEILMIEAATNDGSPDPTCSCCSIHATLLFNPYDIAVGIGGIPNSLEARQKQMNGWGEAIPVDIDNFIGHNPNLLGPKGIQPLPIRVKVMVPDRWGHPSPTWQNSNQKFDPRAWLADQSRANADLVFVCHSQGCNLLLKGLSSSCAKK